MEVFGQWVEGSRYLFYHLNKKDKYYFNHWGSQGKGYVNNDGRLLKSKNNKFKLYLYYQELYENSKINTVRICF